MTFVRPGNNRLADPELLFFNMPNGDPGMVISRSVVKPREGHCY